MPFVKKTAGPSSAACCSGFPADSQQDFRHGLGCDCAEALQPETELDCIFANGMLALTPVAPAGTAFTPEILADLVQQGNSGEQLLMAFQDKRRQIRPAVEAMVKEADQLARDTTHEYVDPTDDIFGRSQEPDS